MSDRKINMRFEILLFVVMIQVAIGQRWAESHSSGAAPMRAEALIQRQQSSLHNSGVKGNSNWVKREEKKQKKENKIIFTTFCKHERRQNMADRKLKIWQKGKKYINFRHLEVIHSVLWVQPFWGLQRPPENSDWTQTEQTTKGFR